MSIFLANVGLKLMDERQRHHTKTTRGREGGEGEGGEIGREGGRIGRGVERSDGREG